MNIKISINSNKKIIKMIDSKPNLLIQSIYDYIKFLVMKSIDTGERQQDELIKGIIYTFLGIVFAYIGSCYREDIKIFFCSSKNPCVVFSKAYLKKAGENTDDLIKFQFLEKDKNDKSDIKTINQLTNFIKKYNPNLLEKTATSLIWATNKYKIYYTATERAESISIGGKDRKILHTLLYNEINAKEEFLKWLDANFVYVEEKKEEKKNEKEDKKLLTISFENGSNAEDLIGHIYPDRTFDTFVSKKYKNKILNALNTFIDINENHKIKYNGMGGYNLGFVCYGEPGTGKTTLIKNICNYLKRDAKIINMRLVKTNMQLQKIFFNIENCKKYVYILDEFDCVQGVLKSRKAKKIKKNNEKEDVEDNDEEKEEEKTTSKRRQLMEERTMWNEMLKINPENKEPHEKIKDIDNKIRELENMISLDTFLTTLDGTLEMRGRVIIATTNYIDKIDSALLRPGRFDFKINLENFDEDEVREYLRLVYKEELDERKEKKLSSAKFQDKKYSPAELGCYVWQHNDFDEVIDILSVKQTEGEK